MWYQGGKSKIAKWIIEAFPKHRCYVEVFGGGASVLLTKERSKGEVYNDVYKQIVIFFRYLRNSPEELKEYLLNLPFSRVEHDRLQKLLLNGELEEELEIASSIFFLSFSSFSGELSSNFSPSIVRNKALNYYVNTNDLERFSERFRGVAIECLDFRECIKKYDSSETLFYCDPPYLERKQGYYQVPFNYRDHRDLAKILNVIEGLVVVSHFESEEIRELYPEPRWVVLEKDVSVSTSFWKGMNKRPRVKELLFLNFKSDKLGERRRKELKEVFC